MAVKPKNVYEDSLAYTLPHEVGFLIQELARNEARELRLSKLSTSAYLERVVRELAEKKLSPEARERAKTRAEKRVEERKLNAKLKAEEAEERQHTEGEGEVAEGEIAEEEGEVKAS